MSPWTPFEHYDHGKDADPAFPDLLPKSQAEVVELTPAIGSEVRGVQLSQLTDKGKDQLALLAAQRKVVGRSLQRNLFSVETEYRC
jgi:sulfonate dioxygenase